MKGSRFSSALTLTFLLGSTLGGITALAKDSKEDARPKRGSLDLGKGKAAQTDQSKVDLLNGVFAMCEIAVVSSRKVRLQRLADDGSPGAQTALVLHNHPSNFLSTIQVGITSVGILSGAIGESALADPLTLWLSQFAPTLVPGAREHLGCSRRRFAGAGRPADLGRHCAARLVLRAGAGLDGHRARGGTRGDGTGGAGRARNA